MILDLFGVLIVIALFFVWFGYYTREGVFTLVGLTFLFLLGVHLMTTGLTYSVGAIENATVSGNSTITTITTQYDSFSGDSSHWYGFLLATIGAAGFGFIWFINRKGDDAI